MDETVEETAVTVGQRLREAREAKGLSIEEIAASTRIPTRHLMALENSEWDKLPAATYSIGFAKNYAGAVGLERAEIGDALREEMGGTRPVYGQVEVYEAADPARTMPRGIVIGALALLALVVAALLWVRGRSLEPEAVAPANVSEPAANAVAPPPAPTAAGPVMVTATDRVWVDIRDGQAILKQGEMASGERFEVPASAAAPTLTTGKPESLQITVGQQAAAAIGPAGQRVSNVSLKGEDLLKQPGAPATASAAPATASASPPPAPRPAPSRRSTETQPPLQPTPAPATATEVANPAGNETAGTPATE